MEYQNIKQFAREIEDSELRSELERINGDIESYVRKNNPFSLRGFLSPMIEDIPGYIQLIGFSGAVSGAYQDDFDKMIYSTLAFAVGKFIEMGRDYRRKKRLENM